MSDQSQSRSKPVMHSHTECTHTGREGCSCHLSEGIEATEKARERHPSKFPSAQIQNYIAFTEIFDIRYKWAFLVDVREVGAGS